MVKHMHSLIILCLSHMYTNCKLLMNTSQCQFFHVCIYMHTYVYPTNSILIVIPSIKTSVSNEIRDQTENVIFLCQAVGEPVPDISWYFNGVMINVSDNSSKYMIMSRLLNITTTENTLTVYNVTSSNVGTYTCNSSNIIGSVTSSGILTVTSKFDTLIATCFQICTYRVLA